MEGMDNASEVPKPDLGDQSALIDDVKPSENAEESALIDMGQPEDPVQL